MKKIDIQFGGTPAEFGLLMIAILEKTRLSDRKFALNPVGGFPFREKDKPIVLVFGLHEMEWNDRARISVTGVTGESSSVQVLAKDKVWKKLQPTWNLIEREIKQHNAGDSLVSAASGAVSPNEHPEIQERNTRIFSLWHQNYAIHEIATRISVSDSTVKRVLRALGLKRRGTKSESPK